MSRGSRAPNSSWLESPCRRNLSNFHGSRTGPLVPRCSLGFAILTFNTRSLNEYVLNMLTALSASLWALMVMKAKPFDSPLLRSLITSAAVTSPACVNNVLSSSCVVVLARFPTYNLASIFNTAFSGINTGIKNATSPITGLAAVTTHKSSYLLLNCSMVPNSSLYTLIWLLALRQFGPGSLSGQRLALAQRPRK